MGQEFSNHELWHSRGYLPHYDASLKYQVITYRLADSLPKEVLDKLPSLLGAPLSCAAKKSAKERRRYVENHLDRCWGSCLLSELEVVQKVIESWEFFDGQRYDLVSYVVMPNHVHLLIKTYEDWPLGNIIRSWKLFVTNFVANHEVLKSKYKNGNFLNAAQESGAPKTFTIWQREYWDRFIRDENHLHKAIEYIHDNPVKAGLVKSQEQWTYSSAKIYTKR
jgi:putative transposase